MLAGCGTPKQLVQYSNEASELASSNNNKAALEKIEQIIQYYESKNKAASDTTYAMAGKLALLTGNNAQSVLYLTKAKEAGNQNPETLLNLARAYKETDNLSYEISTLEDIMDTSSDSQSLFIARKQLFHAYVKSENWEKAENLWSKINDNKEKEVTLLEDYVALNNHFNNLQIALETSKKLLSLAPENETALLTVGRFYYNKAEDRYQREMKAYEKKKTRRQYAFLLDQLKVATKDFKTARFYFEQLYNRYPRKEYAVYLSNINTRLNNKKQAEYYKSKSQ